MRWLTQILVGCLMVTVLASPAAATPHQSDRSGPVFYLQPVSQPSHLDVYNWSGTRLKEIRTAVPITCCVFSQSPSGNYMVSDPTILNDQGRRAGAVPDFVVPGAWANGNRHLCATGPGKAAENMFKGPTDLFVLEVDGHVERRMKIGYQGPHNEYIAESCDVKDGHAIVDQNFMGEISGQWTARFWPVGHSLDTPSSPYLQGELGQTVVSGDERVEAVGDDLDGYLYDLSTHKRLAHLSGLPIALSFDGSLVLELVMHGTNSFDQVVDRHNGKVLWSREAYDHGGPDVAAVAQPDGPGLAFTFVPASSLQNPPAQAWLVTPNRPPLLLANEVSPGII
jgi:hypothetical protein